MAFEVHTPLGLGTVTATDTVRGRTSYKVAGRGFDKWFDETEITKTAWAPVDHDHSVALPYDPTPQYPAIPGETESTIQPIHEIDADERLSPADSITFADRSDDESDLEPTGPNFEDRHAAYGMQPFNSYPSHAGAEADYEDAYPPGHPFHEHYEDVDYGSSDDYSDPNHPWHGEEDGDYETPTGADAWRSTDAEINRFGSTHEGVAFLIPLMGAGAAGAAEGGAAAAAAGGLARGVGMGAAQSVLGGGEEEGEGGGSGVLQSVDNAANKVLDATAPGYGWQGVTASLDAYLATREDKALGVGAGLSDRYIDITASADYHNDPVAQFQHDPHAYISRIGHVHDEPVSPEMEHYGQLVEANASIREAAWKDVRAKAMRLRREGRVDVKDVAPDRIYASVQGDHGTYDVMIAKEGAFGGFGGGHAISNWRCGCEWGRWAFQRRLTYVGRLCSHGYAAYMTMQSAHMKGQERTKKLPRVKRADALQNEPQRLVPELVINDADDSHIFKDVTEDERSDTGPDDIVSEKDIVHFARVMAACDREGLAYPRELISYLVRRAEDQTAEDWKVTDTGEAAGAIDELRDWADKPAAESYGHMEERNDAIRDAVDEARSKGVDASPLVAFRTAAPEDDINKALPFTPGGADGTGQYSVKPQAPKGGAGASGSATVENGAGVNNAWNYAFGGDNPNVTNVSGGGNTKMPGNSPLNPGGVYNGTGGGSSAPKPDTTPGVGDTQIGEGNSNIYTVQPGDTLSGIADANGGGDYNSITNVGGGSIDNKDLITPGQQLDLSAIGGESGSSGGAGGVGNTIGGGSSDSSGDSGSWFGDVGSSSDSSAGGVGNSIGGGSSSSDSGSSSSWFGNATSKESRRWYADIVGDSGGTSTSSTDDSAQAAANAQMSGPAAPNATQPDLDTPVTSDTGATNQSIDTRGNEAEIGGQQPQDITQAPVPGDGNGALGGFDMNGLSGVMDTVNNVGGMISDGIGMAGDIASSIGSIFSSRQAAGSPFGEGRHEPFNGSGGDTSIEFGTSEEYADKARRNMEDVENLDYDHSKPVNPPQGQGVKRAGRAPARPPVVPQVVREQHVGGRGGQRQAAMEAFASFDPLAARSPEDFNDPDEAGARLAAQGGDIVANFQREFGASIMSGGGGGGQFDDFANSPAVREAMRRTAGRNYSPAEQHELIREGDIGGAGNLASLNLRGTHYEDDGVGLFT